MNCRIIGFYNTPYVTGRRVNIRTEVLPHASSAVVKQIISDTSQFGYNILYFVAAYNGANYCSGRRAIEGINVLLFPRKPLTWKWDVLLSGVSDMRE